MLDTIVSIILFIVSFGILICIHEAGHLSMAKLFKVYCKEYSIGFGPAIFSTKKKEGRETKFSIRCIPFGGYVSMFGEGMEDDPEFANIPPERSLEGIKKWKKAIILAAGVILNAVLAFILIFISNVAFPLKSPTRSTIVKEGSVIQTEYNVTNDDLVNYIMPSENKEYVTDDGRLYPFSYEFQDKEKIIHANNFYIVDDNVWANSERLVLVYYPTGNKKEPVFTEGLSFYKAITATELDNLEYDTKLKQDFINWSTQADAPEYYPDFEHGLYLFDETTDVFADINFQVAGEKTIKFSVNSSKKAAKTVNTFDDIGLSFKIKKTWLPFGTSLRYTFEDFGTAAGAVFKGLKILFTGGIRNMSGVVGIFDTSASLYSQYTFSTYLYFWGLISINLAIFNLLPFPGLDGWQLLVTTVEGITRKKIPSKVKTIVSIVGIGLLFLLMGAIIVLDILRIVGV